MRQERINLSFCIDAIGTFFVTAAVNLHAIGVALYPVLLNFQKILNLLVRKLVPVVYISSVQIIIRSLYDEWSIID